MKARMLNHEKKRGSDEGDDGMGPYFFIAAVGAMLLIMLFA